MVTIIITMRDLFEKEKLILFGCLVQYSVNMNHSYYQDKYDILI